MPNNDNSIHILLIEDSDSDIRWISSMLQKITLQTYSVKHVPSLKAAYAELKVIQEFDCILLDLNLPGSRGADTYNPLLSHVDGRVPVIVLTGSYGSGIDYDLINESLEAGAQDYLDKSGLQGVVLTRSINYAIARHQFVTLLRNREDTHQKRLEYISVRIMETWKTTTRDLSSLYAEVRPEDDAVVKFEKWLKEFSILQKVRK